MSPVTVLPFMWACWQTFNVSSMKKSIIYLISILSLMACSGGDDGGGGNTPSGGSEYLDGEIKMSDNTTAILSINASQNCQWVITWSDSGIQSVSPTTGRGSREVTIKLVENPSFKSERSMIIRLSNISETILRPMTITQPKSTEYVKLTPSSLPDFSNAGGYQDITITSNTTWNVSASNDWVKCSVDKDGTNGRVRITVDPNTSKEEREAVVEFKGEEVVEKLTIKQEGNTATTFSVLQITDVTKNSAVVKFSYDSGSSIVSYGVCYAKIDNPDISNALGNVSETGTSKQWTASLTLTGLEQSTTYYVRAYVITAMGTQYSESVSFTTASGTPGSDDNITPNI